MRGVIICILKGFVLGAVVYAALVVVGFVVMRIVFGHWPWTEPPAIDARLVKRSLDEEKRRRRC